MEEVNPKTTCSPEQVRDALCRYIEDQDDTLGRLTGDEALEDLGIDSFGLIELVVFLEKKLNVSFPLDKLTKENSKTIKTLASVVASDLY